MLVCGTQVLEGCDALIFLDDEQRQCADNVECGNNHDYVTIRKESWSLLDMYSNLITALDDILSLNNTEELPMISSEQFTSFKNRIIRAANEFDIDELDQIISEMKSYRFPPQEQKRFETLCGYINAVDYDAAVELLESTKF